MQRSHQFREKAAKIYFSTFGVWKSKWTTRFSVETQVRERTICTNERSVWQIVEGINSGNQVYYFLTSVRVYWYLCFIFSLNEEWRETYCSGRWAFPLLGGLGSTQKLPKVSLRFVWGGYCSGSNFVWGYPYRSSWLSQGAHWNGTHDFRSNGEFRESKIDGSMERNKSRFLELCKYFITTFAEVSKTTASPSNNRFGFCSTYFKCITRDDEEGPCSKFSVCEEGTEQFAFITRFENTQLFSGLHLGDITK